MKLRGPIALLDDSFNTYRVHMRLFVLTTLPFVILSIVGNLMDKSVNDRFEPWCLCLMIMYPLVMILTFISAIWTQLALIQGILEPKGLTVEMAYRSVRKYFFPSLLISVILAIVSFTGFLLFVIPGIIFAVWFQFAYFVLVNEDIRGIEALRKSKKYVDGHFFPVIWRMLAGAFFFLFAMIMMLFFPVLFFGKNSLVGVILPQLLNVFFMPILLIYSYNMYKDLKQLKSRARNGSHKKAEAAS